VTGLTTTDKENEVEPSDKEGWYTDPYGRHEARWMSGGSPTKLVRDGEVESYEEPPDSPPSHPAIKIDPPPGSDTPANDLRVDGGDPETMPSVNQIDDAERNLGLSGWRGPLTRSKSDWQRKRDDRFFP
jgi:hypothetical protein